MSRKKPGLILAALIAIAVFGTGATIGIVNAVGGGEPSSGTQHEVTITTPIDRDEQVAKDVPGFGGLFRERDLDGRFAVYVYMMDESDREGAEQAARAVMGEDFDSITEFHVLKANYPFTDIAEWYRRITQYLWAAVDEVTMTHINYETNQIKVYLSDLSATDRARQVLEEHDIPADAVMFSEGANWIKLGQEDLQDQWRPVVGGVQIQTGGAFGQTCTSGFVAERHDGVTGLVINSHCTNNDKDIGGLNNMDVHQENDPPFSNKIVAVETIDPTPFTNSTWSMCPVGDVCRWSDSAFAEKEDDIAFTLGEVAKPNGQWTIDVNPDGTTFDIVGTDLPDEDDFIDVIGKNAGWMKAQVTVECANVEFSDVTIICASLAELLTSGGGNYPIEGDSGAPVLMNVSGSDADLAGLLFAKDDSVAYRFAFVVLPRIWADLGGSWDVCVPAVGC